jgi:penicillin-binding protein 2
MATTIANLRNPELNPEEDGRDAGGAAVVAMDIKTGQVLVCASYPTYDLSNLFENYNDLLEADLQPMFNRALQAAYPPGSTYKMSMTVAGIEAGAIGRYTNIVDKGIFTKYSGMSPRCLKYTSKRETHGSIDCTEALKVSCNYFYYVLGDKMKLEDIDNTAKNLGLGEPTGVELYEVLGHRANKETKAKLYEDPRWYPGDQVLAAIGQSDNKFTPMQLCSYVATMANHGTRYRATFMNRVVSSDYSSVTYRGNSEVLNQFPMSEESYEAIYTGMKKCAHESGGTARKIFKDYPVNICAKTGTAQTGIPNSSDNGAFVCYAPAENPQIAVAVYGEKAGHGSSLGEIARSVLDVYFGVGSSDQSGIGENQLD